MEDYWTEKGLVKPDSIIVCAAMMMKDGLILSGVRHFSPDMRETGRRIYGDNFKYQVEKQGFINQFGEFLSREEAWAVAEKNGQIRKLCYDGQTGILYSENLY
jgi:hypothetical protein